MSRKLGKPTNATRITAPSNTQVLTESTPRNIYRDRDGIPGLADFVRMYMPNRMEDNWHHRLFYDILEHKVVQRADGRLTNNWKEVTNSRSGVESEGKIYGYYLDETKKNNNILLLAPRFHSKSTAFSINYPLWRIYKNPNIRILIVSATEDIAVSFNRAISNQLMQNYKLIEALGDLQPTFDEKQKWGEKSLIVKRESLEKDPTIAAIGVGGTLVSRRADLIICDDLIDINKARTKQQRAKVLEWYQNVLIPILEEDGQIIVAGTAWFKEDIYDFLWRESEFDIRLKLKALIYDEQMVTRTGTQSTGVNPKELPYRVHEWPQALKAQDVFDKSIFTKYDISRNIRRGTLWDAKWSFEALMNLKDKHKLSDAAFARSYLNEPSSETDRVFTSRGLKLAVENGRMLTMPDSWENSQLHVYSTHWQHLGHLIVAMGVDLAISKKKTADTTAIAVWGLTEKRKRVLLYAEKGRWSPQEIKERVIECYFRYSPIKVRVENVQYQDMMVQELGEDIPVEGFRTSGSNKFHPDTGIQQIASLAEAGDLVIPSARGRDGQGFHPERYALIQELLQDMTGYTFEDHAPDLLMASWFAIDVLRDFDKKMRANRGFFATTALVSQMKAVKAPHRILIANARPRVWKFVRNSGLSIFRAVGDEGEDFIQDDEKFFVFCMRTDKNYAYVLNKITNEIVAKLESDANAVMFVNFLEKTGYFFNTAQIIINRDGEGEALYTELIRRNYKHLTCMQPDKEARPVMEGGFKISSSNLPLAIDEFRQQISSNDVSVPDDALLKEMGELIDVDGSKLLMSFGNGERLQIVSTALWLLNNYDNRDKKIYNKPKRKKTQMNLPYLVFRQ